MRSHRYLREIVAILIFHIFFWGFLYSEQPENAIWTVFGVLAILLNIITVSSVFMLESGNSLYFSLVKPKGRKSFFYSKLLLIFLIDFFWIVVFSAIYGIRFFDAEYFLMLAPRLILIAVLMILAISILSLSFTYRPWIAFVLIVLIVFGGILNKSALFPIHSVGEGYVLLTVILPPFLELIYSAVTLEFPQWRIVFLIIAVLQCCVYIYLNCKLILQKDFV